MDSFCEIIHIADTQKDTTTLENCFEIIKRLMLIGVQQIHDMLSSDRWAELVFYALEFDRTLAPSQRLPHRKFARETTRLKLPVPLSSYLSSMNEEDFLPEDISNFMREASALSRLIYMKDVACCRFLDDSAFFALNQTINHYTQNLLYSLQLPRNLPDASNINIGSGNFPPKPRSALVISPSINDLNSVEWVRDAFLFGNLSLFDLLTALLPFSYTALQQIQSLIASMRMHMQRPRLVMLIELCKRGVPRALTGYLNHSSTGWMKFAQELLAASNPMPMSDAAVTMVMFKTLCKRLGLIPLSSVDEVLLTKQHYILSLRMTNDKNTTTKNINNDNKHKTNNHNTLESTSNNTYTYPTDQNQFLHSNQIPELTTSISSSPLTFKQDVDILIKNTQKEESCLIKTEMNREQEARLSGSLAADRLLQNDLGCDGLDEELKGEKTHIGKTGLSEGDGGEHRDETALHDQSKRPKQISNVTTLNKIKVEENNNNNNQYGMTAKSLSRNQTSTGGYPIISSLPSQYSNEQALEDALKHKGKESYTDVRDVSEFAAPSNTESDSGIPSVPSSLLGSDYSNLMEKLGGYRALFHDDDDEHDDLEDDILSDSPPPQYGDDEYENSINKNKLLTEKKRLREIMLEQRKSEKAERERLLVEKEKKRAVRSRIRKLNRTSAHNPSSSYLTKSQLPHQPELVSSDGFGEFFDEIPESWSLHTLPMFGTHLFSGENDISSDTIANSWSPTKPDLPPLANPTSAAGSFLPSPCHVSLDLLSSMAPVTSQIRAALLANPYDPPPAVSLPASLQEFESNLNFTHSNLFGLPPSSSGGTFQPPAPANPPLPLPPHLLTFIAVNLCDSSLEAARRHPFVVAWQSPIAASLGGALARRLNFSIDPTIQLQCAEILKMIVAPNTTNGIQDSSPGTVSTDSEDLLKLLYNQKLMDLICFSIVAPLPFENPDVKIPFVPFEDSDVLQAPTNDDYEATENQIKKMSKNYLSHNIVNNNSNSEFSMLWGKEQNNDVQLLSSLSLPLCPIAPLDFRTREVAIRRVLLQIAKVRTEQARKLQFEQEQNDKNITNDDQIGLKKRHDADDNTSEQEEGEVSVKMEEEEDKSQAQNKPRPPKKEESNKLASNSSTSSPSAKPFSSVLDCSLTDEDEAMLLTGFLTAEDSILFSHPQSRFTAIQTACEILAAQVASQKCFQLGFFLSRLHILPRLLKLFPPLPPRVASLIHPSLPAEVYPVHSSLTYTRPGASIAQVAALKLIQTLVRSDIFLSRPSYLSTPSMRTLALAIPLTALVHYARTSPLTTLISSAGGVVESAAFSLLSIIVSQNVILMNEVATWAPVIEILASELQFKSSLELDPNTKRKGEEDVSTDFLSLLIDEDDGDRSSDMSVSDDSVSSPTLSPIIRDFPQHQGIESVNTFDVKHGCGSNTQESKSLIKDKNEECNGSNSKMIKNNEDESESLHVQITPPHTKSKMGKCGVDKKSPGKRKKHEKVLKRELLNYNHHLQLASRQLEFSPHQNEANRSKNKCEQDDKTLSSLFHSGHPEGAYQQQHMKETNENDDMSMRSYKTIKIDPQPEVRGFKHVIQHLVGKIRFLLQHQRESSAAQHQHSMSFGLSTSSTQSNTYQQQQYNNPVDSSPHIQNARNTNTDNKSFFGSSPTKDHLLNSESNYHEDQAQESFFHDQKANRNLHNGNQDEKQDEKQENMNKDQYLLIKKKKKNPALHSESVSLPLQENAARDTHIFHQENNNSNNSSNLEVVFTHKNNTDIDLMNSSTNNNSSLSQPPHTASHSMQTNNINNNTNNINSSALQHNDEPTNPTISITSLSSNSSPLQHHRNPPSSSAQPRSSQDASPPHPQCRDVAAVLLSMSRSASSPTSPVSLPSSQQTSSHNSPALNPFPFNAPSSSSPNSSLFMNSALMAELDLSSPPPLLNISSSTSQLHDTTSKVSAQMESPPALPETIISHPPPPPHRPSLSKRQIDVSSQSSSTSDSESDSGEEEDDEEDDEEEEEPTTTSTSSSDEEDEEDDDVIDRSRAPPSSQSPQANLLLPSSNNNSNISKMIEIDRSSRSPLLEPSSSRRVSPTHHLMSPPSSLSSPLQSSAPPFKRQILLTPSAIPYASDASPRTTTGAYPSMNTSTDKLFSPSSSPSTPAPPDPANSRMSPPRRLLSSVSPTGVHIMVPPSGNPNSTQRVSNVDPRESRLSISPPLPRHSSPLMNNNTNNSALGGGFVPKRVFKLTETALFQQQQQSQGSHQQHSDSTLNKAHSTTNSQQQQ